MENSALRNVSPFPPPKLRPLPGSPLPFPVKPASSEPDPEEVFATIRRQIESGQQTPGVVLNAIVVVAQALTGATGAAIAMIQPDGRAVCVARSGETAPEVGDPVGVGGGLSGACLRTGRTLLCDDTQIDPRVDAPACLRLGLRSIAASPLHENGAAAGLLELFSVYSYAFSQEHMSFLETMAELAQAAHAQEMAEMHTPAVEPELPSPLAGIAPAQPLEEALRRLPNLLPVVEKRPFWIWGAAAFAVIVLLTTCWEIWHSSGVKSSAPVAANAQTYAQATPAEQTEVLTRSGPSRRVEKQEHRRAERHRAKGKEADEKAEEDEAADVVVNEVAQDPAAPPLTVRNGKLTQPAPAGLDLPAESAPQILVTGANPAVLRSVLSASPGAPKLGAPVSKGASPPVLEQQVPPVYPVLARSMRVEGPVVLDILIHEDGSVSIARKVSGHPLLTQAAMDAVKRWHYRPAELNGKPTQVETRITVNFKLG
ncbi:MAG TPA: TonB family protein [Terriglobales bacterium]|nr:TonB family protein [Terriglobales bacterium]